ncbi:hypothetical protein CLV98_102496 [Dyadobacter jejuensis]|uniref:Uncharacterized protein n=1 Tax=Dyadobacter jejuensis TaxID=1082580 RepID=A0A316AQ03_9BACT|nr:DUF6252 family protein [Dyadobacter jejuensis]PWJ59662.1 hypothetical protein CLV98_102496 [Dyadobacter jejuensis]
MKPNINLYASTWILLLLFWACEKGPQLTPTTQEGKNTFSCKVNGKVWIPDGTGDWFGLAKTINGGFAGYGSHNPPTIHLLVYKQDKTELDIFLKTIEVGIHELNRDTYTIVRDFFPENYGWYKGADGTSFMTNRNHTGRVVITKADTLSGVISGTFEFEGGNSLGKKVKITDGRFDINSRTVNL